MGKNKKKKNKILPWAKFVKEFCKRCPICSNTINAKFCYKRYTRSPESWQNVFQKLKRTKFWDPHDVYGERIYIFEDLFCEKCNYGSRDRFSECSDLCMCFDDFNEQIINSAKTGPKNNKGKHNTKKEEPKPIFFTNNEEKWKKIIQKVLYSEEVAK